MKKELLKLIALGKIEEVIEKLLDSLDDSLDVYSNVTLLSSRFQRNKRANNQGTIRAANYDLELNRIIISVQELIKDEFEEGGVDADVGSSDGGSSDSGNKPAKRSVFISYSHKESSFALMMQASLEKQNIEVIIDVEDNVAGSEIESFIEKSIKNSSNTVSIISMSSLLSPWVSIEMIKTIKSENITDKNFIAAFIDDAFF